MVNDAAAGLTIGRLAEVAGVSVETVRYYERRGLLDQPPRPVNGYRRYHQGDVDRIAFVRRAKKLGFTLSEVTDLLRSSGSGEANEVLCAARAKLESLRRREAEGRRMQRLLSALVALCEEGDEECLGLRVVLEDDPAAAGC